VTNLTAPGCEQSDNQNGDNDPRATHCPHCAAPTPSPTNDPGAVDVAALRGARFDRVLIFALPVRRLGGSILGRCGSPLSSEVDLAATRTPTRRTRANSTRRGQNVTWPNETRLHPNKPAGSHYGSSGSARRTLRSLQVTSGNCLPLARTAHHQTLLGNATKWRGSWRKLLPERSLPISDRTTRWQLVCLVICTPSPRRRHSACECHLQS
jgi:hypothetical protein